MKKTKRSSCKDKKNDIENDVAAATVVVQPIILHKKAVPTAATADGILITVAKGTGDEPLNEYSLYFEVDKKY